MKKDSAYKTRVLFYDIESSPNVGYTWGKWEQNVIEFIEYWKLLSFAYKWQGEAKVRCVQGNQKDYRLDKQVTVALWKIQDEADIVVAHNAVGFDNKMSNTKFIEHCLGPVSPFKVIDTLQVARKYFKFTGNSLDELADFLGVGRKKQTGGFSLWKGCMKGDKTCWKKMAEYNVQDVVLLERVYNKLKAWMTNHPDVNIFEGNRKEGSCPVCKSCNLRKRGQSYLASGKKKQRYRCKDCDNWFLGKAK